MGRAIIFCIFLGILLPLSLVRSEENNLKKQFEDFKKEALAELSVQRRYLRVLDESVKSFQLRSQNDISPVTNIRPDNTIEKLGNVLNKMRDLSAKVEALDIELYNLKRVYNKLQNSKSSPKMTLNQVKPTGSAVANVGKTSNSSLQMMATKLDGFSGPVSHDPKISAEGIITTQDNGIFSISLPSLQQTKISSEISNQVAFDQKFRKVYWLNGDYDIKRANLDGTDVEYLATEKVSSFRMDSITGNFYYRNLTTSDVRVCNRDGEKCSLLGPGLKPSYGMAPYPSKSLIFWFNRTSVVRANMDGTNATLILSKTTGHLRVDEDSDRLYWTSHPDDKEGIVGSCDFDGQDLKVLVNATSFVSGLAMDGDRILFAYYSSKSVQSVSKDGGNPTIIARTTGGMGRIELYGSKAQSRKNPCENSPCSHLCIPKLESFACLCPEGEQLDKDGATCV